MNLFKGDSYSPVNFGSCHLIPPSQISAIYVGYAISTGEWHVGLAFCTLYTFTYRTTWYASRELT